MKRVALSVAAASLLALAASSCGRRGGGGEEALDAPSRLRVGGAVYAAGAPFPGVLAGASVTLTSDDGDVLAVLSSATGLYEFEDVREGAYVLVVSKEGFRSFTAYLPVEAAEEGLIFFGDDDDIGGSTPTYTFANAYLEEASAIASVSPFGVELRDEDVAVDGVAGQTIVYDKSVGGDVVITFDRPIVVAKSSTITLRDQLTGQMVFGAANPAGTTFTFDEANLDNINVGGLSEGSLHFVHILGQVSYSPLFGTEQSFDAQIRFRAVP